MIRSTFWHSASCSLLLLLEATSHGFLDLLFGALELLTVLLDSWEDDGVVDGGGSKSGWVEKIHQEAQFQEVVEWDESQDNSSELINDVECSEAYPVSEPLFIIFETFRLEG